MAMMDEVFDAAAYVRARCEGGDVEELAAFALCCKADATRLGNMVGRIQRERDGAIETRDAARKAFDEVLQQRQDALESATDACEHAARLSKGIDEYRAERDRAVKERNELRDAISLARGERDSAITARNDARAEAEKAARESVEARLELGEMQRRVWVALGCNGDWLPSVAEMVARAMMLSGARDEAVARAERAEHARDVNRNAWATACQERDRAVQEREDFGLRASAAVARAERAEKALADAAGVADRLGCRIVDLEAEVLCLQGERDRARAEIEEMRVELNSRVNEVNEARRLVRDLAEMTVSRDQLRDEAAMLRQRPTYEARTVAPTIAERSVHQEAGGAWLVCRIDSDGKLHSDVLIGWHGWRWEGCFFVALDAERRPCAWPVPAVEVTP